MLVLSDMRGTGGEWKAAILANQAVMLLKTQDRVFENGCNKG
jgi:hypothetical protein